MPRATVSGSSRPASTTRSRSAFVRSQPPGFGCIRAGEPPLRQPHCNHEQRTSRLCARPGMLRSRMAEKIPRIVANVDVRQFKLDPMDGFLLTRINGRLGTKELASDTGLPEFQVEKTLDKLEKLGV